MKERVEFKAYGRGGNLMGHTWAVKGSIAERAEREMYQNLLNEGHYHRVEVIECTMMATEMFAYKGGRRK